MNLTNEEKLGKILTYDTEYNDMQHLNLLLYWIRYHIYQIRKIPVVNTADGKSIITLFMEL